MAPTTKSLPFNRNAKYGGWSFNVPPLARNLPIPSNWVESDPGELFPQKTKKVAIME
jgi:hypothetical protein